MWFSFHATLHAHDATLVQTAEAQMQAKDSYLIVYFLDEPPSDISMSTLPTTARDVVVARVRLNRKPHYLVMREQSGVPGPPPKFLFRSQFQVVQALTGPGAVGEDFEATFGVPNRSGRMTMVPRLRDEVNRDYFVIAYLDEDGQRHLAGYPISEAKYRAWEAAVMESIRTPWVPKN
jgi:hypothetical protein